MWERIASDAPGIVQAEIERESRQCWCLGRCRFRGDCPDRDAV